MSSTSDNINAKFCLYFNPDGPRVLRPIRINICDSAYLPAFFIVSAVASSLFVSYNLPLKLERSCALGCRARL